MGDRSEELMQQIINLVWEYAPTEITLFEAEKMSQKIFKIVKNESAPQNANEAGQN